MGKKRYKVIVLVGSGGGGHKATARALTEACVQARKDFDLEVIDCGLILGMGATVGDGLYNWLMSSGRAQWIPALHQLGYHMTNLNERSVVEMFRSALIKTHADLVVSCCPHINHAIADAISTFKPAPPLVTLMSDFENSVDHPWMQDHRQHIICGTENAIKQTIALGHPRDRVYGTSGMIVHPSFYRPLSFSVAEGRRRLLLRPDWRTVCVFFGGFAPTFLPKIIRILMDMEEPLNIIVMCGKNLAALSSSLLGTLPPKLEEEEEEEATAAGEPAHRAAAADSGDTQNDEDETPRASLDTPRPSLAAPGPDDAKEAESGPAKAAAPAADPNGNESHAPGGADADADHQDGSDDDAKEGPGANGEAEHPKGPQDGAADNGPIDEFGPWTTYGNDHNHIHLVGYTERVQLYMRLSDVLVGKPGPGVISEAMVSGIPVIVELNEAHTPPQEQAVAEWVREQGVGVVVSQFDELPRALDPERIAQCKVKASNIRNNAVFEVPHILEGVLKINAGRHRRILSATTATEAGLRVNDAASRSSPNLVLDAARNRTDSLPPNLDAATSDVDSEDSLPPRFERAMSVNVNTSATAAAAAVEAPTQSTISSPVSTGRPPLVPSSSDLSTSGALFSLGDSASQFDGGDGGDIAASMSRNPERWKGVTRAEGDSVSVNSSSYSEATALFEEPLRLDEYDVPQMRLLINASGRWGHDVIGFSVGFAVDPETIEFSFSSGYKVTWYKELLILCGSTELARFTTKNADHGPHRVVIPTSDITGPVLKLEFNKAGLFGIHTHGYTRYLDAVWCKGHSITLLWSRERFSANDRV